MAPFSLSESAAPQYNFAAGPAMMPAEVIRQAKAELQDWQGSGLSILETPFTGDRFKALIRQTQDDLRRLLGIPDAYRILFMHGGASAQFSLVPLNLLGEKGQADYVETGYWSRKNMREAGRYCRVRIAASSAESSFDRMPDAWEIDQASAFCHVTSNETANGVQFRNMPDTAGLPLVADMTSDFLSQPMDVSRYGLIYAGAQKNIGPAGLTIVIVRDELLGRAHPSTPSVFNYQVQAEAESMFNTPITFAVYLTGLVLRWISDQGGLAAMALNSERRSSLLYAAIDGSNGFYRCAVLPAYRSQMNVCFTLTDAQLTSLFLSEAAAAGLLHLKGHPMAGGVRASLYNAMPDAGVTALMAFMHDFSERHRHHV